MGVAWGLQVGVSVEEVKWVATSLCEEEILLGLDFIGKWVVLIVGLEITEGFEDEENGGRENLMQLCISLNNSRDGGGPEGIGGVGAPAEIAAGWEGNYGGV
ncbi:hypothetical protein SUGI_0324090 [Cryptomeria japonica]|nr:hypothetical protein SUGI_0324090 [Cryptomeria japonica]